ncbi:MAG: zf-HC2 domain-containing protein [Acidobacteriota bacterium]
MSDECKHYRELMMGLIDNELSGEEATEVNGHITRCRSCREEFEDLKKSSAELKGISYKEPRDVKLDRIWKAPYSRFSKIAGLVMVIGAWAAIALYSVFEIMRSGTEEAIPKMAIMIILIGLVILLIAVIRDRIKTYKKDPYKEVDR